MHIRGLFLNLYISVFLSTGFQKTWSFFQLSNPWYSRDALPHFIPPCTPVHLPHTIQSRRSRLHLLVINCQRRTAAVNFQLRRYSSANQQPATNDIDGWRADPNVGGARPQRCSARQRRDWPQRAAVAHSPVFRRRVRSRVLQRC